MSPIRVAAVDDIGDIPLSVEIPGRDMQVAIVKIGDEIFAINDECSHAKVALSEGDVDQWDCTIECYLHGATFDLRTGEPRSLPATAPVPVYECTVDDGQIFIDVDHPRNNQEN